MRLALGIGLVVFFAPMVGISMWAGRCIATGQDFIGASRHLPGMLTVGVGLVPWDCEAGNNRITGGSEAEVLAPGFPIILFFGCTAIYVIGHHLVIWHESRKPVVET